jgi:beta-lactamase regulating signal transducer with metallopeptidase domain
MTAAAISNPFVVNTIAQTSALQIVNCLVEGTLIAVFAGTVLRIGRLKNSSTKFAVWFSALMGIAALPSLIGVSAVSWAHGTSLGQPPSHAAITLPGSWARYIFAAWAAIATWSLLGVARSLWHLRVLRSSCVPVDPAILDALVRETLERNASHRPVAFCTSDLVQVPTAIGLVSPAVILPTWILQELSRQELNQILLHELAHLRRWDDWTNLAQKLVKALFFFHPAVWWIERQVSLEREMACDDAVVAETSSPRAYAECLAHLAEKTVLHRNLAHPSLAQRSIALAQAALGRIRHTSLRVAQILDVNRPMGPVRSWKPAVSVVAVFAIASVAWISRAPRLIAFQDRDAASDVSPSVAHISPASELRESKLNPPPLVPASFRVPATHQTFKRSKSALTIQPRVSNPITSSVAQSRSDQTSLAEKYFAPTNSLQSNLVPIDVHLPDATITPVAFTETFFVIIESPQTGSSDQPVLQIQWWHLTVLHPAVDPDSNRIPPKKT